MGQPNDWVHKIYEILLLKRETNTMLHSVETCPLENKLWAHQEQHHGKITEN